MLHSIPSTARPLTSSGSFLKPDQAVIQPPTPLEHLAATPAGARRLAEAAMAAAAAIRAGASDDLTPLFNALPDHWLIGQTAAHRSLPARADSADGGTQPSAAASVSASVSLQATTPLPLPALFESASQRRHYAHFLPDYDPRVLARQEGPRLPSGGRWQLNIPETESLLFHGARFGNAHALAYLQNRFGIDTPYAQTDANGYTLLHLASWSGRTAAVEAVIDGYRQVVGHDDRAAMIRFVNEIGPDGEAPLHVAILQENRGLIAALMLQGADVARPLHVPSRAYQKFLTRTACYRLSHGLPLKLHYGSVREFVIERAPALLDLLQIQARPVDESTAPTSNVSAPPGFPPLPLRFIR